MGVTKKGDGEGGGVERDVGEKIRAIYVCTLGFQTLGGKGEGGNTAELTSLTSCREAETRAVIIAPADRSMNGGEVPEPPNRRRVAFGGSRAREGWASINPFHFKRQHMSQLPPHPPRLHTRRNRFE